LVLVGDDTRDVGTLPDGWVWINFTDSTSIVSTTDRKVKQRDYLSSGELPVIGQGQELIGGYTNDAEKRVECELPVIIFGDHTKTLKYVDFNFVAGADGIKIIKPFAAFDPKLFFYFLHRLDLPDRGYSRHFQFLRKEILPLPPLPEQRRIVAEIETQFTRLEAGVAALRRAQANLRRYRVSVLKAACEGRLVPTEAALARAEGRDYEPADALLARVLAGRRARWEADHAGKRYKAPATPDTEGLPELPEGWVWASVKQLGALGEQPVLTGPFGTKLGRSDFIESGVPVLTIGCLTDRGLSMEKANFVSDEKAADLSRYRVESGDLLFSRMATVGRADLVSPRFEGAIINYHLMRLRLASEAIDPAYFISYVRGSGTVVDYLEKINHGVTRPGINTKQLLGMPVALAPLIEQHRIVAEVERRLSVVQELEKQVEAALRRAERLRQAVLKRAFEGRLVPQDPADEPASALLARIRAGKAGKKPPKRGRRKRTRNRVQEPEEEKPQQQRLL